MESIVAICYCQFSNIFFGYFSLVFRDNIEAVSPELKMPCGRGIFSILPVIILLAVMFAAMVSESSK